MRYLLVIALAACGSSESLPHSNGKGPAPFDPDTPYMPRVASADLKPQMTNTLLPFPVGARWLYEAQSDAGLERDEIEVLAETRATWGTQARVVRDKAFVNGALAEDTFDWYAQDTSGNVWYLGEDTKEYANGVVTSTAGSWEAGIDGALPGVVMLGAPAVGDVYRQEYSAGEAEDIAQVVALNVSVTVRAGTFTGCVKTRDRSALDPDLDEMKYYCPGVGNVLTEEGDVRVELIERSGL